MAIYFLSFSLMVSIVKKRRLQAKIMMKSPWMSSIIVSPVVLCLSFIAIYILSMGMLPLWGFQIPPLDVLVLLGTLGLVIGIIVILASESFSPTSGKMSPPPDMRGRIYFFIVIVLLASISEEVLFRGFVQQILDTSLLLAITFGPISVTSGAIISAVLFGVVHIAPAKKSGSSVLVLVSSAIILGLTAGIFLTVSGSLLLPILVHIEFNLVGFILGIRK